MSEKGQAIEWGWIQVGRDCSIGYTSNVIESDVIRCLHADAQRELPAGSRYELRKKAAENYGRTQGMAWYYTSTFDEFESWGSSIGPENGYYLVGQFTTQSAAIGEKR